MFNENDAKKAIREIFGKKVKKIITNKKFLQELKTGMNHELEHGTENGILNVSNDDPIISAKIALAHLIENPRYYHQKGIGLPEKAYQLAANTYRSLFCGNKSRPLKEGEFHPFCANFEGPGTKINLPEVRNFPPFNDVDSVAKRHDLDYLEAFKLPEGQERQALIRKADEKFLRDIEQFKDQEPYYSIGKHGINLKKTIETIPIAKELLGPYKGSCLYCKGDGLCKKGGCSKCQ